MNTKTQKIAFLMQESRMGGIEYNSIHLAKFLDPRFKAIFICPSKGKLTDHLEKEGFSYRLYPSLPFLSTSTTILGRSIFNPLTTLYDFLVFFLLLFPLSRLFQDEKFDLVFTKGLLANFYGALAAKLARIPCLWDMQEIVSKEKCFGLPSWVLDRWAAFFTDGVIVPSDATKNQFSNEVKRKIHKVPNGVDTEIYHPGVDPSKVRSEWGIKKDEILIGHIARFTHWKGQKDFLQAAKIMLPSISSDCVSPSPRPSPLGRGEGEGKVRFVLVGSPVFEDDAYEKEVKELARSLGITNKVLFPGFRDDLADVMAALDIFVHSSSEAEGCPITLITAMAMGKPVVATDVLGNNEIINSSDQGILVPPNDPTAIAAALGRFIKEPAYAESLGEKARERIENVYSLTAYAKQSGDIFGAFNGK